MPIVHAARLRMRYLDQILRNHNRKYTVLEIKDMINLKTGIGISKETVYQDLQYLKREFDAKIIKNSYNQYYYEDAEFSIEKAPLSDDDKILLDVATSIFKQFKSSPIFEKASAIKSPIVCAKTTYSSFIFRVPSGNSSVNKSINELASSFNISKP